MSTQGGVVDAAKPSTQPQPKRAGPSGDDGDLIRRVGGGDVAALATLYDRHAGAVYSLARRIVRDETEAGRVVQQVFAYAWQQAARYDSARASVGGWLLETTRGASIDRTRTALRAVAMARAAHDGEVAHAPEELLATLHLPSPARAQEHDSCTPAEAGRLREALAALPALQRIAIELAYFEGLTLAQISAQLEQPEATITDRILTGLQNLRGALQDGAA